MKCTLLRSWKCGSSLFQFQISDFQFLIFTSRDARRARLRPPRRATARRGPRRDSGLAGLFEGEVGAAEGGLLRARGDRDGLHRVAARGQLRERQADAERCGVRLRVDAVGASSGVAFTCTPSRKKTRPARSVLGIERLGLSGLLRIVGLEENIERLLLREEARHAGHDLAGLPFRAAKRRAWREVPAPWSELRTISRPAQAGSKAAPS